MLFQRPADERGWLKARNETVVWTDFNLSSERPHHKDWNDNLVAAVQRLRTPKLKNFLLSQAMKNDSHALLLDAYFWHFVDHGDAPQNTGIFEGESLSLVIAREFSLPLHEAESRVEIARQEVAL